MNVAITCPAERITAGFDSVPTRPSLLGRLRDMGDDLSWQTFFDTYWRLIYGLARKSGLSDAEAQDIVQETVIAVAKGLPEFHYDPAKGSFKSWLRLITRRRVNDYLRRLYRSLPPTQAGGEEEQQRTENVPDTALLPDVQLEAAWEEEWRQSLLHSALLRVRERAEPKQYQAFDCCVLQNIPAGTVARMLGLSRAQVYLAKHRLTQSLKRAVANLESDWLRGNGHAGHW